MSCKESRPDRKKKNQDKRAATRGEKIPPHNQEKCKKSRHISGRRERGSCLKKTQSRALMRGKRHRYLGENKEGRIWFDKEQGQRTDAKGGTSSKERRCGVAYSKK